MKKHTWLVGFLALSIYGAGCGDKTAAEKDSKTDSSAAATSDKKDDKAAKSDKSEKSDKKDDTKGEPAKADDTKKPDSAVGSGSGSAAPSGSALKHLSDDCQVALRLDVAKLVGNASIQREIVPTLDEILATASPKDKEFVQFQGFLKDTGIDYKKSIKDLAVCVTNVADAEHTWAVIVGGDFKPDTFATAIANAKSDAKKGTLEDLDGHKVFVIEKSAVIGQAADGAIIISGSKDMFQKTSAATGASAFKLDASKYMAFAVREQALGTLLSINPKKSEPFKAVKKATGYSDLDDLKSQFTLDCGTPEDAKKLDALVTLMKDELVKKSSGDPMVADQLKTLTSRIEGSNVVVELAMAKDSFDKALKLLGDELKKAKTKI